MRTRALALAALLLLVPWPARADSSDWCWDRDEISAWAQGSTITVLHDAALYNCCPEEITHSVTLDDHLITIEEVEINPECICLCCFALSVSIADVAPGTYTIDFGWYDYESQSDQHRSLELVVPDLGQTGSFQPGTTQMSDCLVSAAPATSGADEPSLQLYPVRPNPTTGSVDIRFALARSSDTRLAIYSALGREVRRLLAAPLAPGEHFITWDGRDDGGRLMPSGVYLCRLRAGRASVSRAIVRLRDLR